MAQLRLCEESCAERLASTMFKPRIPAKGKPVKRKVTKAEQERESPKPNAKAKRNTNSIHSNSNSNDSNSTEIKRRKVEKSSTENKVDEVDTSKDDVTIFLSNLEYR